jgi:capsular exopolysaccharide synthesis family protein
MDINYDGSSIKIQKFLSALFKYKWINLFIFLLFLLLGIVYYKSAQPIYESIATIEIKNVQEIRRDIFGNDIGESSGLETQMDILGSNLLIEKTMKYLGSNVAYLKHDGLKKEVLYKNAPFKIKNFEIYDKKFYGTPITIVDLGKNQFKLIIKESLKSKLLSHFIKESKTFLNNSHVYTYGKPFKNETLSITIDKKSDFQEGEYTFIFYSDTSLLENIKHNLTIEPASFQSSVLKLSYKDTHAYRAKEFLDNLIDNYLKYSVKDQTETEKNKLSFVDEQLDNLNAKLANSENSLEVFRNSNGIIDIDAQKEELINKIGRLKEDYRVVNVEFQSISNVYKEVKRGNYSVISSFSDTYPVLATMVNTLEETKAKKEDLLSNFTPQHPDVVGVSNSIRNLRNSILDITKEIRSQISSRRSAIEKNLKSYSQVLEEIPTKEKELGRHKRLFEVNENIYNFLLQKQSEISIEKASQSSSKKVIDYARIADIPLSPKLPLILAISSLLGLFAVFLHTLMRIKFDVRVKSPISVLERTKLPLYGTTPYVKDKDLYNQVYTLADSTSKESESFREIVTNLKYLPTKHSSKVIVISSTMPNEGKTVVTSNLSVVLGMGDKKCILLSLDLRKPELHNKFSLPNENGMSTVLSGQISLKEVIWQHDQYPNLNIITSGYVPPNPYELIDSSMMAELIDSLREYYDYIVIDTPPVSMVSDAIPLMKMADINLFVLKSEFSEFENIGFINSIVDRYKIKNAGFILNSVKEKYGNGKNFDSKYIHYKEKALSKV